MNDPHDNAIDDRNMLAQMTVVRVEFTIEPSWTHEIYSDVIEIPAESLAGLTGTEREAYIEKAVENEVNNVCSWGFSELAEDGEPA